MRTDLRVFFWQHWWREKATHSLAVVDQLLLVSCCRTALSALLRRSRSSRRGRRPWSTWRSTPGKTRRRERPDALSHGPRGSGLWQLGGAPHHGVMVWPRWGLSTGAMPTPMERRRGERGVDGAADQGTGPVVGMQGTGVDSVTVPAALASNSEPGQCDAL